MNKRKLFQRNTSLNSEILIEKSQRSYCKNSKGITLIALVISIIVMLIFAGVSLNATIGDNGIITQAQNANYAQSVATLQDFINQYYVENYDKLESANSKIDSLRTGNESKQWFYQTQMGYVVYTEPTTGKSYACYLINKDGLPSEIKNSIIGGDAGEKQYRDYATFKDVYGITADLKVYYCSDGFSSAIGINQSDFNEDNPLRVIFDSNSKLGNLIMGEAEICTAQTVKAVKELTIDENSGINDFSEFYNLTSLNKLTLNNVNIQSLDGLENALMLKYIYLNNCTISNFDAIKKCTGLEYLYLYKSNDEQVNAIFSAMQGVDYSNLKYLGIFGYDWIKHGITDDRTNGTKGKVTDINILSSLTEKTKESIQYLYLSNNKIQSIQCLSGFKNVSVLRIDTNELTTLNGLENMSNLKYLRASGNKLGNDEDIENLSSSDALISLNNKKQLYMLDLRSNTNLHHISYIENNSNLRYLWLTNDENLKENELTTDTMKNLIAVCGTNARIPTKYNFAITTNKSIKVDVSNQTIISSTFESTLKNNTNLKYLNIHNLKLTNSNGVTLSDDEFTTCLNNTLSTLTSVAYLQMSNLSQIKNINFLSNMKNLKELDLRNTPQITDLTILENLRNSNKMSLGTLIINNDSIDLTKIQNVISKLNGGSYWHNDAGLVLGTNNLYKKLPNCINITNLVMHVSWKDPVGTRGTGVNVDLSNCTKLTNFSTYETYSNYKMPNSVTSITYSYVHQGSLDASQCSNLKTLNFGDQCDFDILKSAVSKLSNNNTLENLSIQNFGNMSDLEFFSDLKNCTTLKNLSIVSSFRNNAYNSMEGVENLKYLESLSLSYCNKLKKISNLENMQKLKSLSITTSGLTTVDTTSNLDKLPELESLNLSNNNISDITGIYNCKKLASLNIQNNCIYDMCAIIDDDGNTKTYNNISMLANLNYTKGVGVLKNLYLAGNSFTDFSEVQALQWNNHNGW